MTTRRLLLARTTIPFFATAMLALAGCSDEATPQGLGAGGQGDVAGAPGSGGNTNTNGGNADGDDGSFTSDTPTNGNSHGAGDNASDGAGSPTGAQNGKGTTTTDPSGDATKTIEEADVIQVQGDTLYALSQYSGLSIIDIHDPTHMAILGRYSTGGTPFEMYLQDNVVFAMWSSWGQYVKADNGSWEWVTSSHIAALDVSNPAQIKVEGQFDLPGDISDSRIVGTALYAVSYQDGYCWNCDSAPNTTITSLDISNLASIKLADKLTYAGTNDTYGWYKRSIFVNQDRMYVAGNEWSESDGYDWDSGHSTIQVIDITDPNGKLVKARASRRGARSTAAGRWMKRTASSAS